MKIFLHFIAISLISLNSIGQTNSNVIIPSYNDKYSDFIKKLESGQTEINYKDFRESFIESEQFKKASESEKIYDSLEKEIYGNIKSKNYQEVIRMAKLMLGIDYTSMKAHKFLQQTYKILGDTINYKKYHDIEFGLLNSIIKKGDGRTCATAWPVIQIREEYFILEMIGAVLLKQNTDNTGGFCDKMDVQVESGKKTYYFEITKVFKGYEKLRNKN